MAAPPGWHLQPDGRERYWDGSRWTEQFRMPAGGDPTAPPPLPSWADGVEETQALEVSGTQALPRVPEPPATAVPMDHGGPAAGPYGAASSGAAPGTYGAPEGYGAPGGQWQAPPQRSGGLAKGCLIAALVGFLIVGAAVVALVFFVARAADEVVQNLPTTFPTELPSGFPSDLPTDLPTEGLGERIELTVGEGFELQRAAVASGWTLEPQGAGVAVVNISGMRATLADGNGFPVLFTMSFETDGGESAETVCTAPAGSSGAVVDVSCVPLFGDVADATRVTVTASL